MSMIGSKQMGKNRTAILLFLRQSCTCHSFSLNVVLLIYSRNECSLHPRYIVAAIIFVFSQPRLFTHQTIESGILNRICAYANVLYA